MPSGKSSGTVWPAQNWNNRIDGAIYSRISLHKDKCAFYVVRNKDTAREFVKKINADGVIKTEIDEAMVFWLEHHLREIGVLSVAAREYFVKDENGVWNFAPKEYEYCIIQPAIRYYHLKEAFRFVEDCHFTRNSHPM